MPILCRFSWPGSLASPLPLENYTGTYANNIYGTATVANAGGNLTRTLGKTPVTFYLSVGDGNTFSSTSPQWQWGPEYDDRVTFSTVPDGTVRELTTTLLLQKMFNQNATFVRADC
ncbi:MAG: DUF3471 domain-containing protein [Methanoregula sp.]|nr:DUF3471 domain-containing protein [Methanoregula sp.]